MKVLIYSHGTRGDLQPYLAVAHALNRAGHTATLVGPSIFEPFAESYGVRFAPVTDEGVKLLQRPDVRKLLLTTDPESEEYRKAREAIFREFMPKTYPVLLRQFWDAARGGADLLVHSHHSRQVMHQMAEKLGIPSVLATLHPNLVASRRYPAQLGSLEARPDNLEQHARVNSAPLNPLLVEMISTWRTETLGLPLRDDYLDFRHRPDGRPTPVLHGFSPHVLEPAPEWPDWVHTTGFWSLPANQRPSAELLRFLEAGEPPVFFGFGSLAHGDPEKTGQLVLDVVRRTGVRAVVVTGWGGISITDPPANVLVESDVPYDWLFPRVRAAVHAGGPGTLNAALEAGIPQMACPFHKEQLMWGNHLRDLGVAPEPIPYNDLTVDGLVEAVRHTISDPEIADNTRRLAEKLKGENGAENAVKALEHIHREA
ncbi:glycosyltransferase [Streptomyces atratus]|uniref:glycosyltransferase n=1 Tax=Streptomyces atratus TaxID=1893 RepID=UPI0018E50205|nr:glycosyltransferase [Streptomyces atratus]